MEKWFEDQIKDLIWTVISDFYTDIATWAEDKIEAKLRDLKVGDQLSSSPAVLIFENTPITDDPPLHHVTFLIRGRVPLYKGVESVFMRIEVTISTHVDLVNWNPPIEIVEWRTVIGDLKISKEKVFSANIALGYDSGVWLGRGALKIIPAGFGLDIVLGGLSDRGAMIGLDIDLPVAIPLGNTGLCLKGMGGDFAYNFIPRLEGPTGPIASPTAKDYITWARDKEPMNRWDEGPITETSVGVGIRTDLGDLATKGNVLALEPIGLTVLTPGPVFVLGGNGKVLNTDSAGVEGYIAVDIASASLAAGLMVKIRIPKPKSNGNGKNTYLVDASGTMDMFFSLEDASAWYINLGTDTNKIAAKIISDIIRAELYLMLNNDRLAFGAGLSVGGQWKWWKITLTARLGSEVAAIVGWNPVLLEGWLEIWAELGLKIWKFGFMLRGSARVLGHTPNPTKLDVTVAYKLDLPWPIPDIKGSKTLTLGDEQPVPPSLTSPMMAGQWSVEGENGINAWDAKKYKVGAFHWCSGRQWLVTPDSDNPDPAECWPDVDIVVPFSCKVICNVFDKEGKQLFVGSVESALIQGGYIVDHTLNKLELYDITDGNPVAIPDIKASWAAAPGDNTGSLHVNATDPFSWLLSQVDLISTTDVIPGKVVMQDFGSGPAESFSDERRFGELLVKPGAPLKAYLLNDFSSVLPTRVLGAQELTFSFRTHHGDPIEVEEVTFFLLTDPEFAPSLLFKPNSQENMTIVQEIFKSLRLVAVTITLSPPTSTVAIVSAGKRVQPLLFYAVQYKEARKPTCNWKERVILKPGTYMMSIEGKSEARYPDSNEHLPDSKDVTWFLTETFKVINPDTLRPYIATTTIGDSRIFDVDIPPREPAWNPTMHGFGFPIYRKYKGSILFRVSYMDKIFPKIKFRLIYETGEIVDQILAPAPNTSGESYLPEKSQRWIHDHCGKVIPDKEITISPLPKSGPAAVRLLIDDINGNEVKLDEWTCYVSQFESCADHLVWPDTCITVFYGPGGRSERAPCALPGTILSVIDRRIVKGNRIDPLVIHGKEKSSAKTVFIPPVSIQRKQPTERIIGQVERYPEELTEPPVAWRLPSSLTGWLKPLDADTGLRFACFASDTSACFSSFGNRLKGINDTVDETTIEAVVDSEGRPYALWLRTPEPLDWRRVTLSLRIEHIMVSGDCPTEYAHRYPLDLQVEALPSPDGSSAFLVGSLEGCHTQLPRGVYTLTLRFDTENPTSLPRLKPSAEIGGPVEQVIYIFVQPNGEDWPLPVTNLVAPAYVWERIAKLYRIDSKIIEELWKPKPDPRILTELLNAKRPVPTPKPGDSDPVLSLVSSIVRLETVSQRLTTLADSYPDLDTSLIAREIQRSTQDSGAQAIDKKRSDIHDTGGKS